VKSPPPTIPMRPIPRARLARGSCLGRLGALSLGAALGLVALAVGLGALYWWWLPAYVDGAVRERLTRAEARLGAPIRCEAVRLEGLRTVTLDKLTVGHLAPSADPAPMIEVPTLHITIDLGAALRGEARPREVVLLGPVVRLRRGADGRGDLDPLLAALDARLEGAQAPEAGGDGAGRWIPAVQVQGGTVLIQDDWTPTAAEEAPAGLASRASRLGRSPVSALRELSLRLEAPEGRLGEGASLVGAALVSGGDERWVKAPARVHLEATRASEGGPWRAALTAQPAVFIARVPGMEGLSAALGGVTVTSDGAVALNEVAVRLRGVEEPLLEAAALRVTLSGARPAGVWVERPRVSLSTGEGGSVETLRELWRPSAGGAVRARAEALASRLAARRRKDAPVAASLPVAAEPAWASALARLPAEIHVEDGALRWQHLGPQPEAIALEAIRLDLDHQLLRGRLEGSVQLRHVGGGEGSIKGEIFYKDGRLQIDGEQPPMQVAALARRLHPKLKILREGAAGGRFALSREGWERPWALEGELRLKGLVVAHERIAEAPLEDIDLTLAGSLRWDPAQGDLRLRDGVVTLEEAASLRLEFDLEGIGHGDPRAPLDLRRIKLRAFSAPAEAQALYEAIPSALRADLEGTRLKGRVGLRFEATIDPLRIADMEVDSEVTLKGFDIVAYHPERDVRGLLGEFTHHVIQPETGYEFTTSPGDGGWTPLQAVSPYMVKAIRTNEDGSFYSHGGVSWLQVRSTLERNIQERRFVRGASTVSMQVVKNVFLSHRKTLARKLQEVFLTLAMEQVVKVPKERIMEIYLNIVEWGPYVYGIRSAARHYFGKSPSALTPGEAVWLVSILPGPRRYHSYYSRGGISDVWWDRMRKLLKVMLERGHLTPEEFAQADAARPLFSYSGKPVNFASDAPEPAPPEDKEPLEPGPAPAQRFDQDANPIP
jgi:hypothetical protein